MPSNGPTGRSVSPPWEDSRLSAVKDAKEQKKERQSPLDQRLYYMINEILKSILQHLFCCQIRCLCDEADQFDVPMDFAFCVFAMYIFTLPLQRTGIFAS
jgi:hypothetical protein